MLVSGVALSLVVSVNKLLFNEVEEIIDLIWSSSFTSKKLTTSRNYPVL